MGVEFPHVTLMIKDKWKTPHTIEVLNQTLKDVAKFKNQYSLIQSVETSEN